MDHTLYTLCFVLLCNINNTLFLDLRFICLYMTILTKMMTIGDTNNFFLHGTVHCTVADDSFAFRLFYSFIQDTIVDFFEQKKIKA